MPFNDFQRQEHIFELQRFLHSIAMSEGKKPLVIPDGVYGLETAAAVRAFQRSHGLPSTGDTDSDTWNEIVSEYQGFSEREPQPYSAFPSAQYIVKIGNSGSLVYIIQAMLLLLSQNYDNLQKVDVSGNFTRETAEAVEAFQRKYGLPDTGSVDSRTWNMLAKSSEHTK